MRCNIQHAGYDFDKYDDLGDVSYSSFIDIFHNFPWQDEIEIRDAHDGSEPTISIVDEKINKTLWVSVVGDRNKFDYIIGLVEPTEIKTWFGFGKPKIKDWVMAYTTEDIKDVELCFKLFMDFRSDELQKIFKNLPLFLDLPARKI